MRFGILILTYNRPRLLEHTLRSLAAQTHRDFFVRIVDNGTEPPLHPARFPALPAMDYVRLPTNIHPCDAAEPHWAGMEADFFGCLADDDVLVPTALARVAAAARQHPDAGCIFGAQAHFDHDTNRPLATRPRLPGEEILYDARSLALGYGEAWGINVQGVRPPPSHSSAGFVAFNLLRQAVAIQGRLFVKPFGDVGFLGPLLMAGQACYLTAPLAVIGHSSKREMQGATRGNRALWNRDADNLTYSPVRGLTFPNLGMESHLKVFVPHGVVGRPMDSLRPQFYRDHLRQILTDAPPTQVTLLDAMEAAAVARPALARAGVCAMGSWRRTSKFRLAQRLIEAAGPPAEATISRRQRWLLAFAGWLVGSRRIPSDIRPAQQPLAPDKTRYEDICDYATALKG